MALTAAYSFDEGGGLVAADISGNGRDIAITTGSWTPGKDGWGVIDNSASNVTIGPGSLSNRTVMCWFRIDSDTGASQALVSSQPSGSNLNVLYVDPSGGWTIGYYDATSVIDISSPLSLTFGTWYHAAVTTGTGGIKLYLNGTLVASSASTACRGLTNAYIGKGADGNGPLDGVVDGLRTFDTVLSASEISMYMNTPTWQGPYVAGTTYTTINGGTSTFDIRPDYHILTGSVQVGDWLVVVLSSATNLGGTNVPTPPGGWTTIVSFNTVGSGTMCFGVYARKYDTAGATYTWSQTTGGGQTTCRMFFVRGAGDISNWVLGNFDYRQNTGTTTTSVAASITTTAANSLALIVGGERTLAAETESQISCSNSYEFYFDNISDHSLTAAIKPMPTAGATGSVTITYPNAHNYNGIAGILGIPPIDTSSPISWTL